MLRIHGAESVAIGHPDKVADQISDAILDAYLAQDPHSRVACETLVTPTIIVITGEITSNASVDVSRIARRALSDIGYTSETLGLDSSSCAIQRYISPQSQDIAQAIKNRGAGDQGIMIGYATDETDSLMPLPIVIAHSIMELLRQKRTSRASPFLGPDGKVLVQARYDGDLPLCLDSIVLSAQHTEEITVDELRSFLLSLLREHIPDKLLRPDTRFFLNPAGRFVIGGPRADAGMTGRKQMVDAYGCSIPHGGGAFSGKDPTKVDRSGAYLARYIAKNIVAAKLAKRCEVTLTYVIGLTDPISLEIDHFGTSKVSPALFQKIIPQVFALDVAGMIDMLDLDRPIYQKTAYGGHFGRLDPTFTWERTDKVESLLRLL